MGGHSLCADDKKTAQVDWWSVKIKRKIRQPRSTPRVRAEKKEEARRWRGDGESELVREIETGRKEGRPHYLLYFSFPALEAKDSSFLS